MKTILGLIIICLFTNTFSSKKIGRVETVVIYRTALGDSVGQFLCQKSDVPGELFDCDQQLYVKNNQIYVFDGEQARITSVDLAETKRSVVVSGEKVQGIAIITDKGELLTKAGHIYCPQKNEWRTLISRNKNEGVGIRSVIPVDDKCLLLTTNGFYIADSAFTGAELLNSNSNYKGVKLIDRNVVFLSKERAFVSTNKNSLARLAREQYQFISAEKYSPDLRIYQAPDSTEMPGRCQPHCGMQLVDYDNSLISYWTTFGDSLIPWQEGMPVMVFCIFDKSGRMIAWFYEPMPPVNWYVAEHTLHVNKEGRIFRILFHKTDGIRIVEYLWKEQLKEKKVENRKAEKK